ncbi:hypothetical protein TRFO_42675 [Tritrichomonas foetus]|uniref:Uncharacterized protein n=1 Tax=Tritrichomonas foetus TaxID=1144522 RepID=A0A1J4KV92_9EUKA|nr:hypothetical protein TRFO_42675 [Tritrichomonas foetus]|eukprot:OHT15151.1 hypothetical protein TRFO_42675 [Tritrichomonas foetus]
MDPPTRPLSRRRRIDDDLKWSEDFDNFLNISKPKKHQNIDFSFSPSSKSNLRQIRTPKQKRDGYEGAKKAFLSAQNHRATLFKKYQNQMEKTENLLKKGKTPPCIQKQIDFTRAPVKQTDDHVIERVITVRNQEYRKSSKGLPKGYVIDLKTYHSLPPDRSFFVKGTPRVFFWG